MALGEFKVWVSRIHKVPTTYVDIYVTKYYRVCFEKNSKPEVISILNRELKKILLLQLPINKHNHPGSKM